MNYKKQFLMLLFFGFLNSYSQEQSNDSIVKRIKKDVTDFFINKKVLDKNDVKESLNYVFIVEINTGRVIDYNSNGIYIIGVHQSHSKKHVLIKENTNYRIFELNKFDLITREILDYSIENKLDQKTIVQYIKNIIQVYEDNYDLIYTTIETKE